MQEVDPESDAHEPESGAIETVDHVKLGPFIPFIILLMFSYTKDDIEVFMMYFLFSQTQYACDFNEAFGIYLYVNAAIQVCFNSITNIIPNKNNKKRFLHNHFGLV